MADGAPVVCANWFLGAFKPKLYCMFSIVVEGDFTEDTILRKNCAFWFGSPDSSTGCKSVFKLTTPCARSLEYSFYMNSGTWPWTKLELSGDDSKVCFIFWLPFSSGCSIVF